MSGRHSFTVLNIRTTLVDVAVGQVAVQVFRDDPNRMGAKMWCAGANSAHIVISDDSAIAAAHTWAGHDHIATWNNPVVVPWWDKGEKWAISRDVTQTLHVIEYTNEEAVPR